MGAGAVRQLVPAGSDTEPEVRHHSVCARLLRPRTGSLSAEEGLGWVCGGGGHGKGRDRFLDRGRWLHGDRRPRWGGGQDHTPPRLPPHASPVMASGTDIGKLRLQIERSPPQPDSQPSFRVRRLRPSKSCGHLLHLTGPLPVSEEGKASFCIIIRLCCLFMYEGKVGL